MIRQTFVAGMLLTLALAPLWSLPPQSTGLNAVVATRIVTFLQPAPSGPVSAAIVFQPGNAASEEEANGIERAITAAAGGRVSLKIRRVSATALGQLAGARVAFLTSGLRSQQDEINAAAASQAILTISPDASCAMAAKCVVAISGGERAQIIVSKAAARQNRIRFGSAFLMLVKEV